MEVPEETSGAISDTSLPQSGEIVLAKFEALTSHVNDSGSQIAEQIEEQVLGYLEVQPSEVQLVQDSSTFYLQPQEIEIDGEHLILAQGEEAGEIIVVVSTDQEHSADQAVAELAQGAVVNATVMHSESGENKARMFVVNQSNTQFDDRKVVTSPSTKGEIGQLSKSLSKEQTIIMPQNDNRAIDNAEMKNTEQILLTETSKTSSDVKEKDTELTKNSLPQDNPSSTSDELKDRKLMQLACIAHEMQIERKQFSDQIDNCNTSVTTTEVPSKADSNETKPEAIDSVHVTECNASNVSSDVTLEDQSTLLKAKNDVPESSISGESNENQNLEAEERNRRSMEAAETIAALQHSDRLPLDEMNQLTQNDQSVPNYSSLLENVSLLRKAECSSVSSNITIPKGSKVDKEESQYECEDRLDKKESHLEKEDLVISDICASVLAEVSSNCEKKLLDEPILASAVVNEKVEETPITGSSEKTNTDKEIENSDKERLVLTSCEEIMLEASINGQNDVNSSPLSQPCSFSQETNLSRSTDSNVALTLESSITEGCSNKIELLDDVKMSKNHNLPEAGIETISSGLSLKQESKSKLQIADDDTKVVDESTGCVSDLNNSEINIIESNTKERTNTKETTNLKDKFPHDTMKHSSSQDVSVEIAVDNSSDQVVPQIDIASCSVGKGSETVNTSENISNPWLKNKQGEFIDVQKITSLQDLHRRENLQQKLIEQPHCLSNDIPCAQKDESYHSQIKHTALGVSGKTNATEVRTVTQISDKPYSAASSALKELKEERKRITQTADYIQKQPFTQSLARPVRSKQPVVIHLRSSIAKPSMDDLNLNKDENSNNKSLACDAKEAKNDSESLSKSVLSEKEENYISSQLSIVNNIESINTVSKTPENESITEGYSSIMETNSFVELPSTGSSDHSSVESETSHSYVEILNDQIDIEKDSKENELNNDLEERTECLTPKIKKQFQLLISPEKSDAEVNLTSIKSKINQKLQFDSDGNDDVKDMEMSFEEPLLQVANNEQESQLKPSPRDVKKSECESNIQLENEIEETGKVLKRRGTKRKISSNSVSKVLKLNSTENEESAVEEQKIEEKLEIDHLKKTRKRKTATELEKILKKPRTSLKKATDVKDEILKAKKSLPIQKSWNLRSHSASAKEDPKCKLDVTSTIDQTVKVQSFTDASSTEVSIEGKNESTNNSIEAQKIHPVCDKIEPELPSFPSVPMLESLGEDSDHSGISEDHISRPPVLITRNKFLNSLSPKSKRQYIKKHVKSKSVSLSVQKAQSPRKYSSKGAKSLIGSSDATSQKKHLRTKSEQVPPSNSEKEEEVVTPIKICDFRIRCQTPTPPSEKVGSYSCVGCSFRTSRVQNLIHHYREKCLYTGPDAFHWDVDQIEGAKREDSQKTFKANGCSTVKHIIDSGKNMIGSTTTTPVKKLFIKSSGKMEDTIDSDSNSDDLPPAFDTPSKKKFGFAEDDVVWVEWKTLHWPALVRKIYMKPKKASIMFIDSPSVKKGIRVSIKKISTFNNAERNKKYLSEGRAASLHSDTLVKAVQKAEDFLRKRCLGINISAAQFFGSLDDDFPEYMSDKESSIGTPSESGDISRERHLSEVSSNRSFSPVLRINEESTRNDDIIMEDKNEVSDQETLARKKEKRKNRNAKLLQCIKGGKVETHLLGVYRNTIPSERHKLFHSSIASERNQLKHVSWFGPIDDEEQQEEIYDYCLQLFKSACQYKETFDLVAYMFEVWVPEAVVRAISRECRLSMIQAEETFAKGVQWSKAEKEEARKEFASFPFTEEDRRDHREKMADSLRIAGVQENIILALDL